MENIFIYLFVFFVLWGIAASVKNSIKNTDSQSMGNIEARLQSKVNEDGIEIIEVQAQGLLPVKKNTRVGFATFIFDTTDGQPEPIISMLNAFQEPNSLFFRFLKEAGECSLGYGFVHWAPVGIIVPGAVCPPYSGKRSIEVILWLIDIDRMPINTTDFNSQNSSGIIWKTRLNFSYDFKEKGYKEVVEHRDEAKALSIQFGVAVAMADGSLDDREGLVLRNWIVKAIAPYNGEMKSKIKNIYNMALKESFSKAKKGRLNLSGLADRLNEIGEKNIKYEAIELCYKVMVADGKLDPEEQRVIRNLAASLALDYDEIEKIRDQEITKLDPNTTKQATVEDLLNIDPNWDKKRIRKHLRAEFQKWNNRMNVLNEGEERDNAQKMLDLISKARKKYA